jgi:hypothetical protein
LYMHEDYDMIILLSSDNLRRHKNLAHLSLIN